jgi:ribosomal protein L11 methyltransferase
MAWLQVRVASLHPEFAEEILLAHGARAVSFVDAEDEPVLEPAPGATPLWRRTLTLGLFDAAAELAPIAAGLRELLPDGADAHIGSELVEDQDWVRVWLKDCPPLKFGERLWVVPREKRAEVTQTDAIVVELDPGLAFGTGTHPTTALCLEWLATQDLAGRSVIDYGCGSGILAIAALKLGAARAFAVDLDPQALTAARENAVTNGVGERIALASPEHHGRERAEILLANILANPLIELAPRLVEMLAPRGRIALAGLLERQADEVRAAYAGAIAFDTDVTREGWTRLAGTRR